MSKISLLYDFERVELTQLSELLKFCAGEEEDRKIELSELGPFSQREVSGADQTDLLLFKSGKILALTLYGETHYSEDTIEPAAVYLTGYVPKPRTGLTPVEK